MKDTPKGMRFSHLYLRQPELLPDSKRMRRRIGTLIGTLGDHRYLSRFGDYVESEHGISVVNAAHSSYWPGIVEKFDLRDVLDLVTSAYKFLSDLDYPREVTRRRNFIDQCRRIFHEEQVSYRVDDEGGVHFAVDAAFEETRVSTILALSSARYTSVRALYEQAFSHMDVSPPDGKAALRASFHATECIFRLMFANSHQLSASEVQKHLEPLVNRLYEGQKPAVNLAQKLVASLKDWIDGAHFYRHEPGSEEPAQPPIELAIYMLSQAGGHIRWLAKLDEMNRQPRN